MHYIQVSLGTLFGLMFSIVAAATAAEEVEFSAEGWKRVQEALVWHGQQLVPDGVAGPRTRAAIRSWQAKTGYSETGDLTADQYYDMIKTMPTAMLQLYRHPPGACWTGGNSSRGSGDFIRFIRLSSWDIQKKEDQEYAINWLTSRIQHDWLQRTLDLPLPTWCEDGRLLRVTPIANYLVNVMFATGHGEPLEAFIERGGNINHRVRIVDYSENGHEFEEFRTPLEELMSLVNGELFMEAEFRPSLDQAHSLQRRAYPVIDLLLENGADPDAKHIIFEYDPKAPSILEEITSVLTSRSNFYTTLTAPALELYFGIAERLVKYGATCLQPCQDALQAYRTANRRM